jgi:phospholipid/cholesterol/gamma-HCH transport system ATP-binding protein
MENVIEVQGLTKSFNGREILKGIDLFVKRGENVVVLGRSGEGKSVTIQCIAALLTPDSGTVKVLGQDIHSLGEEELKELRKKMGFLFQQAALYDSMSVRENLSFPLRAVLKIKDPAEIKRRSEEALEAVGLEEAIDKMPAELSGGQRKRMGLARTLVVHPEIILYDEPTTGLDTITSKEISQLIMNVQKRYKATAIIITHDMHCAKVTADRILIMNDGKYIADDSYEALENSPDQLINSFFKL